MKKITLLLFLFVSSVIYSQKNGISYQAIIFNPNGGKVPGINNTNEPLANKNICLQFTIIDSDTRTEYQETINTTTDAFGMVNTIIGSGNQSAGYAASFSNIYWTSDQKSLKVAMDINGKCSTFVEISNQLFTSVPSAFSAQNAENVTGVVSIESGGTNAVTVLGAKTNLALEKVDNTSDLSKPISTATQIVLNLKEDSANKSTDLIIDANSNVKYPTVQAVKTYIDANASTGLAGLAAETARALAAELANSNAIASNTTAITANANAIAAEATTARTAELANATAITAETNRATAAEATKENTDNKSIDVTFASNSDVKFPTEKAVKTYVDTSVSTTSTALATEVARATAAEGVLTTSIANETSTRGTADATLTTNLNAEVARATVAEGVLTTSIANEASTRGTADATLTTNLNAEITRANAAEATKENTANKSIDGTFASNSDVKFPTEKAVKTYVDASVSTTSTALATEVLRATAAEGVLTTSIANEASTRATGDATLTTNLNAEISRATAAETGLTSSLALKVDKISGKGLSTEDYSSAEKTKLAAITGTNTGDQDLSIYAPLASPTFTGTVSGITKTMVGLGNVDNTTDLLKPISTATQSALDLKADLASPTFTGTVSGITKTMVGLGNVDNTTDLLKPISTATQSALDLKADLASPTFTGTVSGITKTMVGLGNVDNTTDLLKPISTATQSALDLKADLVSPTFTGTVTASGTLTTGVVTYPNSHGTSGQVLSTTGSGTLAWTTPSTTANAYSGVLPLANGGTGSATQNFVDLSTTQTVAGAKTFSSAVTGSSFVKSGGTSIQYLMADGTVSSGPREVNAEFTATASQTNFTVTQTPLTGRIIKMYVNGVRISNTACSFSGTTLTYIPSNNGNYNLTAGDRIQIDFYY
ncbi:hypothetical protein SAMN05443373_105149 [Flavobacterium granuli]|uniref:Uncharacterized protein n=1 Tax=Flavobacterium granuli TaxID=280093 RepID=A0A1M5NX38_9FLAO|nr:hypothetical protein [Flavobacterium granuli]SHG94048.1 hypothetical protein SAMN05443373_105149 [Flavobacterium granuli]